MSRCGLPVLTRSTLLLGILLASGQLCAQQITWRSIGPGQFGAMFGIAVSPHDPKVIVGGVDMGNAFMTRDGGKSWRIIGRNGGEPFGNPGYRGVWGVCFDPRRPERIWIGSTHGVYLTTDSGDNWKLMHGGTAAAQTHAITCDPTDPDIVYVAAGCGARNGTPWVDGNVYKTIDGGKTWQTITPPLPAGRAGNQGRNWVTLAIDPQSPFVAAQGHSRIYLCGQAGFYVSDDAGAHWSAVEGARALDLALAPGNGRSTVFVTVPVQTSPGGQRPWSGGVYASTDGGKTWGERNTGLEAALSHMPRSHPWSMVVSCPAAPGTLYWGGQDGVFRTTDSGQSWQLVTRLGTEWKQAPDFDGRDVYWRLRTRDSNFDQSFYNAYGPTNGLACSQTNPNVVAYTDNAGCGLSVDGGQHWTEPGFEFGQALWTNEYPDRPAMVYTHQWRSRGIQLIVPNDVAVDPFDPNTIAIGHCDTGLEISRDNGQWWEWAYHGILDGERNYIRTIVYDPAVRGRLWVGGGGWGHSGHVNASDDGGRHFRVIGIPQLTAASEQSKQLLNVNALALDAQSSQEARTLYAATDLGLFKTSDGGKTWVQPTTTFSALPRLKHVLVDPSKPGRLYVSARAAAASPTAGLYRSDDGGVTWQQIGAGQLGIVKSVGLCPANGTIYVVTFAPGSAGGYWEPRALWRSDDAGATWRKLSEGLLACVAVHPTDPNRLYFAALAQDVSKEHVNVYRSTDAGGSWTPIADDIPLSPGGDGNKIVFDPTNPKRFFVTHNSGTWEGIEK